jgi:predicted DNA-binding transcriptional regulator AlpA
MNYITKWDLQRLTGMTMNQIYNIPCFPKPTTILGHNQFYWLKSEIEKWMAI